jgi:hypothetical protein
MSSLFFIGGDRADPMPGKNERQGRSTNIFFFHEGSLQGHAANQQSKEERAQEERREAHRKFTTQMTATLNLIFGFALAGFGLFGLACQVRELLRARASIGWPAGEALITDARVVRGHRTSYNTKITYRYNHRGTEYTGRRLIFGNLIFTREEAESLVERFAVGTRWEVRICEARPQLSVLHPGVTGRLWSILAFFVVFSIGSVGFLIHAVATLR